MIILEAEKVTINY